MGRRHGETWEHETMAVWGQGDQRWIVEDRADGQNVNAWHWTEKDVTKMAEQRLGEMCKSALSERYPDGQLRFESVSKFSGFVNVCNRKGKMKVTFDLQITLKWKKQLKSEDGEVLASSSGTTVMEEIIDDEPECELKVDKKKVKGEGGAPDGKEGNVLRETSIQLVNDLIAAFQSGAVDMSTPKSTPPKAAAGDKTPPKPATPPAAAAAAAAGEDGAEKEPAKEEAAAAAPAPVPPAPVVAEDL